ncbi:MAG TPA: hypothetical protein VMT22_22290 [Terriglobales bacterium]|jgi:hypothetical protein|nr:hypothetical protein [Terriglobales bacterium]
MSYETGLTMEERVTSIFQPDTLLPEQYFDTFRRKLHLEPEKKLMLAILEDAVACYQKYVLARDGKGRALFHEAETWVQEKKADEIFSFDSVCEMLGFDPNYLRRGLAAWKERALTEHSHAKVYQLAPRSRKSRRTGAVSARSRHGVRRAANR